MKKFSLKKKFYDIFFKKYHQKKAYMIGLSHVLNMRNKYSEIETLSDVEYKIYSQNGEDGILDYLLKQLDINKPKFIEIGVGDYSEANTRFIFERASTEGIIIDCIENLEELVKKNTQIWRGNLNIINKKVNSENINEILSENNVLKNLDIFSLDIDGIDYWIINEMPKNFSKIAILEFNPLFGDKLEITVPNKKNFIREEYHYSNLCFGMSLKAAINIMKKKNFYFIGTNLFRNNAFFISHDFKKEKFFKNLKINSLNKYTDFNFLESRDKNQKLNYLNPKKMLNEIINCEVIDLSNEKKKVKQLKEILT